MDKQNNEMKRLFNKLNEHLNGLGEFSSEEELEQHIEAFMLASADDVGLDGFANSIGIDENQMDAMDMIALALEEPSKEGAVRKVKAVLKKHPGFLEAERVLLDFTEDNETKKLKYEMLLKKEKNALNKNPDLQDSEGHYYEIFETRPYMRLYLDYVEFLLRYGKLRLAAIHGEKMLELNPNDNLGVRYLLLVIYMVLEDLARFDILLASYDEESVSFVLPAVMIYFKLDMFELAEEKLESLVNMYPNFLREYSSVMLEFAESLDGEGPSMYGADSMSEIEDFVFNMPPAAIAVSGGFFSWIEEKARKKRVPKKKSSGKRVSFPGKRD